MAECLLFAVAVDSDLVRKGTAVAIVRMIEVVVVPGSLAIASEGSRHASEECYPRPVPGHSFSAAATFLLVLSGPRMKRRPPTVVVNEEDAGDYADD